MTESSNKKTLDLSPYDSVPLHQSKCAMCGTIPGGEDTSLQLAAAYPISRKITSSSHKTCPTSDFRLPTSDDFRLPTYLIESEMANPTRDFQESPIFKSLHLVPEESRKSQKTDFRKPSCSTRIIVAH